MKFSAVIAGMTAALTLAGAAHAGSVEIVYWGKGHAATVDFDGQSYQLEDDWTNIESVESGTHELTLHVDGASLTRDVSLSSDNVASEPGASPAWCLDIEDYAVKVLNRDDCDDMLDWYAVTYGASK